MAPGARNIHGASRPAREGSECGARRWATRGLASRLITGSVSVVPVLLSGERLPCPVLTLRLPAPEDVRLVKWIVETLWKTKL